MPGPRQARPTPGRAHWPAWSNFRDLGGLGVVGGTTTRPGWLYRSDAPHRGDPAPATAPRWPPALVIDLRQEDESPDRFVWAAGTEVQNFPLFAGAAPDRQVEALGTLYQHMVDAVPDRIAQVVNLITQASGPVLLHCAVGKDRTGLVCAILLDAAGVRTTDILDDYGRTAPNMRTVIERLRRSTSAEQFERIPTQLFESSPDAVQLVLDRTRAAPGGSFGWLVGHGAEADNLADWSDRFTGRTARWAVS